MKTGDKLICYNSYIKRRENGYKEYIFEESKIYTIGNIDYVNGIIGIIMNDKSITEFNLSYDGSSEQYFYKKWFKTLAEYRDIRINEILDL
jgi:hypothetical protein